MPDSSKVSSVERNYDLTRRGKVGATRAIPPGGYQLLDDAGRVGRRELRTAELAEKLLDLSCRSAPIVRWAYSAFTYEVKRNHAKDPYALPPSVVGAWEGPDEIAQPSSGRSSSKATSSAVTAFTTWIWNRSGSQRQVRSRS